MNGKQLKNSILQWAIQGKLVPQDPNDEPAIELLKRIRDEKARLVKEGKIKKSKDESVIFRGEDGQYYEKIGKTTKCIQDEIPFEVPESWVWCRMGSIGDWGAGATPTKGESSYYGGDILWLRTGELNNGIVYDTEIKITEKALKECSLRMNKVGDVLVAMYGATIGKLAIVGKEMTTNQACCACTPFCIYNYYLFFFLMASQMDFVKNGEGGAQPNISREKLIHHLIPLPSLAEQKRIVAKIEELMPLVERYTKAQEGLDKLNAGIKGKLRASILQEAIQGKLVPQDANDEPAIDLLKRLNPKVKPITDDVPFGVPKSWCWVKFGEITKTRIGKTPSRSESLYWLDGHHNWVSISDMEDYGYITDTKEKLSTCSESIMGEKSPIGTLIMSFKLTVGRTSILKIPAYHNEAIISIFPLVDKDYALRNYLFHILPIISNWGESKDAIKGKTLNSKSIYKLPIPLPPLAEQKRIVAKIEELFGVLGRL